jgi:GNAT superfamily N-acetyltransferase
VTEGLRVKVPETEQELEDWRHVHNTVIPAHHLSLDDVRDRVRRHRILVAYRGGEVVGSTTVRPPQDDSTDVIVIARVLAEHRGQGIGTRLYELALAQAAEVDPQAAVGTVVLASNEDGLRFAERRGFAEIDRYTLPGETVEWVDLRRPLR